MLTPDMTITVMIIISNTDSSTLFYRSPAEVNAMPQEMLISAFYSIGKRRFAL
jgi:hypothetical protein